MAKTTKDSIIWPDLTIHQPKTGYRFSMDSVVLARLTKIKAGDRILEIGSGSGVCLLIAARSTKVGHLTGVELQKTLFEISLRNLRENGFNDRIKIYNHDIKNFANEYNTKFDVIISNPPFYSKNSGRLSKTSAKLNARHEKYLDLKELLISAKKLLTAKGSLYLIYNSNRIVELLEKMRNIKIEPKLILPIYPKRNHQSNLIWIKSINNAKQGLKILSPLFFYCSRNKKSPQLRAFYSKSSAKLKKLYPEIFSGK